VNQATNLPKRFILGRPLRSEQMGETLLPKTLALLAVVVISYRQTCHAYLDGGGAYAVSRANLGVGASLGGGGGSGQNGTSRSS
jgi:hypothetical protein